MQVHQALEHFLGRKIRKDEAAQLVVSLTWDEVVEILDAAKQETQSGSSHVLSTEMKMGSTGSLSKKPRVAASKKSSQITTPVRGVKTDDAFFEEILKPCSQECLSPRSRPKKKRKQAGDKGDAKRARELDRHALWAEKQAGRDSDSSSDSSSERDSGSDSDSDSDSDSRSSGSDSSSESSE